ncbi:unnamed protein product [Angiostrongylus costaricensis]|uniref:Transposase n=1 Tax=Angiostrongylus costaricensis TaxID=334426 RepID=A0A0R3PTC9_ANGCS|nr:unnamed protein product [Angiostrongylus costaricensis]
MGRHGVALGMGHPPRGKPRPRLNPRGVASVRNYRRRPDAARPARCGVSSEGELVGEVAVARKPDLNWSVRLPVSSTVEQFRISGAERRV